MRDRQWIYSIFLCILLGMSGFACSVEIEGDGPDMPDQPGEEDTRLRSITLHIGASETLTTRAYGGDPNAREGEFMNTLRIFIVDSNNYIEKIISASDSVSFQNARNAAGAGCVTDYTTTVDLTLGEKTIYAFANMEAVRRVDGEILDNELKALDEGSVWPEDMSAYIINNPAKDIDLKNNFIPMSVRQEVDLTVDGQRVSVALVRLVARLDVSIHSDQGNVTVTQLSVNDFADKVSLFEPTNGVAPDDVTNTVYTFSLPEGGLKVANNETVSLDPVYVNETWDETNPFEVSLTLANGVTMNGETISKDLERNHILPLRLGLSDRDLNLTITAQVAPIGGYPVQVYTGGPSLTDNYSVALPEGCTFSITGEFLSTGDVHNPITAWLWGIGETATDPITLSNAVVTLERNSVEENDTEKSILGHLTALPGQEVTLHYTVYQPNAETGTLTITTEALEEFGQTRSAEWCAAPRWYEPVMLMRNEETRNKEMKNKEMKNEESSIVYRNS